jgi:hypothetical protein
MVSQTPLSRAIRPGHAGTAVISHVATKDLCKINYDVVKCHEIYQLSLTVFATAIEPEKMTTIRSRA